MNAFPGSVRRRLLAKPGRWRHHRHNLVNCAVCGLGGYPVFHYPKEEEDNVVMDNRPFYTIQKSITGRRAHYPIHPGGIQTAGTLLCCVRRNSRRWQPPFERVKP
nr:MAG TPA: hypothetical protein [Caudoviricetes sp.]